MGGEDFAQGGGDQFLTAGSMYFFGDVGINLLVPRNSVCWDVHTNIGEAIFDYSATSSVMSSSDFFNVVSILLIAHRVF